MEAVFELHSLLTMFIQTAHLAKALHYNSTKEAPTTFKLLKLGVFCPIEKKQKNKDRQDTYSKYSD